MLIYNLSILKSVYTSWSNKDIFISVERKWSKDEEDPNYSYDDLIVMAKFSGCEKRQLDLSQEDLLTHATDDRDVEIVDFPFNFMILRKDQFNKIVEMTAKVNKEFEGLGRG